MKFNNNTFLQIYQIKTQECSIYKNSYLCTIDPYCDWSSSKHKCSTFKKSKNAIKEHNKDLIKNHFIDDSKQSFSHLVVDKNTGSVYIGGLNRLYHFNQDLDLIQNEKTGPVYDPYVSNPTNPFIDVAKLEDNHNKVLVLDQIRSRLIVCGTLGSGMCQVSS